MKNYLKEQFFMFQNQFNPISIWGSLWLILGLVLIILSMGFFIVALGNNFSGNDTRYNFKKFNEVHFYSSKLMDLEKFFYPWVMMISVLFFNLTILMLGVSMLSLNNYLWSLDLFCSVYMCTILGLPLLYAFSKVVKYSSWIWSFFCWDSILFIVNYLIKSCSNFCEYLLSLVISVSNDFKLSVSVFSNESNNLKKINFKDKLINFSSNNLLSDCWSLNMVMLINVYMFILGTLLTLFYFSSYIPIKLLLMVWSFMLKVEGPFLSPFFDGFSISTNKFHKYYPSPDDYYYTRLGHSYSWGLFTHYFDFIMETVLNFLMLIGLPVFIMAIFCLVFGPYFSKFHENYLSNFLKGPFYIWSGFMSSFLFWVVMCFWAIHFLIWFYFFAFFLGCLMMMPLFLKVHTPFQWVKDTYVAENAFYVFKYVMLFYSFFFSWEWWLVDKYNLWSSLSILLNTHMYCKILPFWESVKKFFLAFFSMISYLVIIFNILVCSLVALFLMTLFYMALHYIVFVVSSFLYYGYIQGVVGYVDNSISYFISSTVSLWNGLEEYQVALMVMVIITMSFLSYNFYHSKLFEFMLCLMAYILEASLGSFLDFLFDSYYKEPSNWEKFCSAIKDLALGFYEMISSFIFFIFVKLPLFLLPTFLNIMFYMGISVGLLVSLMQLYEQLMIFQGMYMFLMYSESGLFGSLYLGVFVYYMYMSGLHLGALSTTLLNLSSYYLLLCSKGAGFLSSYWKKNKSLKEGVNYSNIDFVVFKDIMEVLNHYKADSIFKGNKLSSVWSVWYISFFIFAWIMMMGVLSYAYFW